MDTHSVETTSPPAQADLVPIETNIAGEWSSDLVDFELWMHRDHGFILANPVQGFEVAGIVSVVGQQMSVVWRGAITSRPQAWLNAQRAIAARELWG